MKFWILMLSAAASLSACTPVIETRVNTIGGAAGMAPGGYMLAQSEQGVSPELAMTQQLVGEKLAERRFIAAQTGPLHLEVTASVRPAILALATTNAGGVVILSPASTKRGSAKCSLQEFRVGITLTRIADGQKQYSGMASETHCKRTFAQVMPALVDAALGDLRLPVGVAGRSGAYILKRKLSQ